MAAAAEVVSNNGGGHLTGKKEDKVSTFCILLCGMSGIIIGHDIVTSGELTTSLFLKDLDALSLTAFTSSLYAAALLTYYLLWKKIPLILGWIIIIAGTVTSNFAQQLWMVIVGRILYGIGVGFSIKSAQVYATPYLFHLHPATRMFVLNLSIAGGIIMSHPDPDESKNIPWWGLLSVIAVYAIIKLYLVPKEEEEGGEEDVESADGESAVPLLMPKEDEHQPWVRPSYYMYLVAALAVPLIMQKLTGVNLVLMFYAPVLFHAILVGSNASLLCSVVINVAIELSWHRTELIDYWFSSN